MNRACVGMNSYSTSVEDFTLIQLTNRTLYPYHLAVDLPKHSTVKPRIWRFYSSAETTAKHEFRQMRVHFSL